MLTTWSYSRYSTYKQCPRKAKYLYIDKFVEPPTKALEHGVAVHSKMEEYLTMDEWPIPEEGKKFAQQLEALKEAKAIAEEMWAFDINLKSCGSWDKEVWLRGKLDAHYLYNDGKTCKIVDFKTGKLRPKNLEQLELYALMAFHRYPWVEQVVTELWYLDAGHTDQEIFDRAIVANLHTKWRSRTKGYFIDTRFDPKPTKLCAWCAFSIAKGGPCEF